MRIKDVLEVGTGSYHTPPDYYGGTERVVTNIANGLKNTGIRVQILDYSYRTGRVDPERIFLHVPLHINPRFNTIIGNFDSLLFSISLFVNATSKKLNLGRYDVIHCHKFFPALFSQIASYSYHLKNRPIVVYSNHDPNLVDSKGISLSKRIILFAALIVLSKLVRCITFETLSSSRNAPVAAKSSYFILQNPIDVRLYSGNGTENAGDILYVAKISRVKRQAELIKAFVGVQKMVPNARLMLIGGVEDRGYFEELMKTIDRQNLGSYIIHYQKLPATSLVRLYKSVAINVSLSLTAGTDLSVREGLAAGAATVAPNIPPVAEFLTHSKHALLVDPNNAIEVSEAIIRLLRDSSLRAQLQRSGNAVAEEVLSTTSVANRFVEKISPLLDQ